MLDGVELAGGRREEVEVEVVTDGGSLKEMTLMRGVIVYHDDSGWRPGLLSGKLRMQTHEEVAAVDHVRAREGVEEDVAWDVCAEGTENGDAAAPAIRILHGDGLPFFLPGPLVGLGGAPEMDAHLQQEQRRLIMRASNKSLPVRGSVADRR